MMRIDYDPRPASPRAPSDCFRRHGGGPQVRGWRQPESGFGKQFTAAVQRPHDHHSDRQGGIGHTRRDSHRYLIGGLLGLLTKAGSPIVMEPWGQLSVSVTFSLTGFQSNGADVRWG